MNTYPITAPAGGSQVVLDANALTIAGGSGETTNTLNFTGASNGNYLRFNSNGIGDFISFTVNQTGTYTISVTYVKNQWQGITQLLIDGANQGSFDGYAASGVLATATLGTKTLTAGSSHTFRFQVTGKNAQSQNHQISLDTITLTP